jgi:hypothetical protein
MTTNTTTENNRRADGFLPHGVGELRGFPRPSHRPPGPAHELSVPLGVAAAHLLPPARWKD